MRFSSITISNYRQYKDLHLEFKKGATDLQIIVGDNGTGKTNLLNAFTWCLYGSEPHLGSKSKEKNEPKLNKSVILEMVDQGITRKKVEVIVEIENDEKTVRVSRSVPFKVHGIKSVIEAVAEVSFSVTIISKDSSSRVLTSEKAQDYVNRILPESIREYFFFDGEQLDSYFKDNRSEVLRSAVHSISGIDSISNMQKRTMNAARDLSKTAQPRAKSNADDLLSAIQDYESKLRNVQNNISESEISIKKLKENISSLDGQLRGLPDIDALEDRIKKLKSRKKTADEECESAIRNYCLFARKREVDFAFYDAAKEALKVIEDMEKDNMLPPAIDAALLRKMLRLHKCEVCNRPLTEVEEENIEKLLSLYKIGTETSNILTTLRSELRNLQRRVDSYHADKEKVFARIERAESNLSEITQDLLDAENDYGKCPNPDQVKLLRDERKQYDDELEKNQQGLGKRIGYKGQLEAIINKKRQEYRVAIKKQSQIDGVALAADFGFRAADILSSVKEDVINETREMIEHQAEDLFKGLVWKDSKCDHIGLTEDYQLSLYDRYGFSCAGTCSAAERNLLALSFTLAMHKVSGFDSPMIIDTPIARASGDNRSNFATTLAEVSESKQLILTFTPDEYSESIASVFDPIAASNLRLRMDESEMIASVKGED